MPTPKLPYTTTRLSTSVTIRLIPQDTLNATILANPAALLSTVQTAPVGAVEAFSEANNRPAQIRFQMDATAPGVVQEAFPNQVEARTLTLERVVLYDSDALEIFQITGGDIVQQFAPFALVKIETVPANSTDPTRITIYQGCWFTSNPKAFSVRNDLKIVQTMNITYAEREVVLVSQGA